MCEIIVLNELTITDDEESYEFMKTLWQQAAAAKCSAMSVNSDSNSESDNIETDNLKTDELAELDQRKTRAEQSETSDSFVVIDDVSEGSEQSDTAISSSSDDLITSSSAVWKVQASERSTAVSQNKQLMNSTYHCCITVSVSQSVILSADQHCVALQNQLQAQAVKSRKVYDQHKF